MVKTETGEMQMKDNLKLWKSVQETDPNHTKQVEYGARKYTSINANYQIKQATKQFGPFGMGWGVHTDEKFEVISHNGSALIIYTGSLYYNIDGEQGVIPIASSALLGRQDGSIDDDCVKKVATDALTKGLSRLGFNADVFEGMYDDNKYVSGLRQKYNPNRLSEAEYRTVRKAIESVSDGEWRERAMNALQMGKIDKKNMKTILKEIENV